jgi:WD40 repeat protein
LVTNQVDPLNFCTALFSNADLTLHFSFIVKAANVFIRNFELHQIVKRVDLQSVPLQMGLLPNHAGNACWLSVLEASGTVRLVDMVNTENQTQIETTHEEVQIMKVCYNGRYILTGGSGGDISLWNIKKREVTPEEVAQIAMGMRV